MLVQCKVNEINKIDPSNIANLSLAGNTDSFNDSGATVALMNISRAIEFNFF